MDRRACENPPAMRPLTRVGLMAVGLVTLAVSGCGEVEETDAAAEGMGTGPVVAHREAGDGGGMEALIEGPVALSERCLMVGEFSVIWPHGTSWDDDLGAVRLSDGRVVALGDRVSGGGGYPYLSDLGPDLAERLADCPTNAYGEVASFNAGERISLSD